MKFGGHGTATNEKKISRKPGKSASGPRVDRKDLQWHKRSRQLVGG
jgi:hypothetical protein